MNGYTPVFYHVVYIQIQDFTDLLNVQVSESMWSMS